MKYYATLLSLSLSALLSTTNLSAQHTVKMSAIKANNYGVAYSLPKSVVEVKVNYSKIQHIAGEHARYAERYLSLSNPVTENATLYRIESIEAVVRGEADKDNSYLVTFRSGTTAPYVTLTRDGLICAINDDTYTVPAGEETEMKAQDELIILNPKTYLSEEILRAGSSVKQAELIAKQIYLLRETRNNILTGEADNMPPDGNAYKLVMSQIDEQEKALTSMFIGQKAVVRNLSQVYKVTPDVKSIDKKIICRFSTHLGLVPDDDLAGAPIYLNLTKHNTASAPLLTAKEEKAFADKMAKGIVYNLPEKATLQVDYNGKNYVKHECDIVQYGTQEALVDKMFENNKKPIKVIFYPELGSIKQIIE